MRQVRLREFEQGWQPSDAGATPGTAPILSGWVQTGERWDLWCNGRSVANVTPASGHGVRVHSDGRKISQTKQAFAASVSQGRRYAERWCAARLYPDLPLREAVARLTDSTPIQPEPPLLGLPPTCEQQQQARRLAEAGAREIERIKAALEPRKPPAETKPRVKDPIRAWVHAAVRNPWQSR
ncbi:hypothetical protein ACODUI_13395 [Stenotrophomonas geniculata]|jgi:hypothetical protein|uniref:hypothetical protein n=1 Tax=Stenotrophomonas geniculata TaxID=86188 RepID=UPI00287F40B2|nr:hypothetical protein [Stenotrophomonas geniculata]WNF11983.1 hypothetical protein RKE57_07565 [Stenotrophomonas geniculata]